MSTTINIKKQIAAYEEGSQISSDISGIDITGDGASASMVGSKMVVNIPGGMGNITYYLNQTVTQAPYKEFSSIPTGAAEQTIVTSIASGATTTIQSFQTASGVPGTTNIPGGLWSFYLHFSGTATDTWDVFVEVYKRDLGGIETLLLTTDVISTSTLSGTPTMILTDGVFPTSTVLTTDRIVVKVRVTNTDSTTNSITFHTEGSTNYSVATTTLNQTVPSGAVTSVSGAAPISSSGGTTPTISITQATALVDGYLDSADFATFSAKQDPITLTTTGTTGAATFIANILNIPQYQGSLTLTTTGSSGASTLISNTLNIPTYTLSGLGGVPTTRTLTINGTAFDLSADRTWNVGTVTSVGLSAGTGISLGGTNPVTSSGTITVTNSAPDQVVILNAGTGIGVTGTYPNFTITNTDPTSGVTLTSAGGSQSLVNDGTGPTLAVKGLSAGTGILLAASVGNDFISISNTSPASSVTLTSSGGTETLVNDGTGPSLATKGITAGTGISLSSTSTDLTVTNSAPDQIVALTAGTGINITGTYPNFTIDNTVSNTNIYNSDGTFTGDRTVNANGNALVLNNVRVLEENIVPGSGTLGKTVNIDSTGMSGAIATRIYKIVDVNGGFERFGITRAGNVKFNNAYLFPIADGTTGQVLTTNGGGVLTFQTPSAGSSTWNVTTQAGASSTAASNDYVLINAATHIVTLPAAANGIRVGVKMINATVTSIQIKTPSAGITIDGVDRSVTGLSIFNQYDAYTLVSDGTNWFIMG